MKLEIMAQEKGCSAEQLKLLRNFRWIGSRRGVEYGRVGGIPTVIAYKDLPPTGEIFDWDEYIDWDVSGPLLIEE